MRWRGVKKTQTIDVGRLLLGFRVEEIGFEVGEAEAPSTIDVRRRLLRFEGEGPGMAPLKSEGSGLGPSSRWRALKENPTIDVDVDCWV